MFKLISGRKGKSVLRNAGRIAKKGLATRKARINAGQVVMFQRTRDRRVRKGRRVAFGDNPVTQSSHVMVPVADAMAKRTNQGNDTILRRTEPSDTLTVSVASNGIVAPEEEYMVVPTNPKLCAAINQTALQYQYFKFVSITLTYTPNQSFDQSGLIAVCAVPSTMSIKDLSTFDQVVGQAKSIKSSTKAGFSITFTAKDFNTVFKKYAVCPYADLSQNSTENVQGYIAYATNGFEPDADGTTFGDFTVTYTILLSQHQFTVTTQAPPLNVDVQTSTLQDLPMSLTEKISDINDLWVNPSFVITPDSLTVPRLLTVQPLYKHPFVVEIDTHFSADRDGTTMDIFMRDDHQTDVRVYKLSTFQSLAGTHRSYLVVPMSFNGSCQLQMETSGTQTMDTHTHLHMFHVRSRDVNSLVQELTYL